MVERSRTAHLSSRHERLAMPVDCEIDLAIDVDGHPLDVRGSGSEIDIRFRDAGAWRAARRSLGRPRITRSRVRTLARGSGLLGWKVTIRVGSRVVAKLGAGVRSNWLGRLLGLERTELALAALWLR